MSAETEKRARELATKLRLVHRKNQPYDMTWEPDAHAVAKIARALEAERLAEREEWIRVFGHNSPQELSAANQRAMRRLVRHLRETEESQR